MKTGRPPGHGHGSKPSQDWYTFTRNGALAENAEEMRKKDECPSSPSGHHLFRGQGKFWVCQRSGCSEERLKG